MKTITEYQPMIFSRMADASERRGRRSRELKADLIVSLAYAAFGFWLSADLGLTPWMWQFWLIFGPAFAIAEMVRPRRQP